jgi:SNF2 family DNA or RNA helicase
MQSSETGLRCPKNEQIERLSSNHDNISQFSLIRSRAGSGCIVSPGLRIQRKSSVPLGYYRPSSFTIQQHSGKMDTLDRLLCTVRRKTDDRVVLVSNFTQVTILCRSVFNLTQLQTLDVLVDMCNLRGWKYLRLDGTTSVKKRQKVSLFLVNVFCFFFFYFALVHQILKLHT